MSGRTLAVAAQQPFELPQVTNITDRLPQLFDVSHSIRIMEVAKKYLAEKVKDSLAFSSPSLTPPGGRDHAYALLHSPRWSEYVSPRS